MKAIKILTVGLAACAISTTFAQSFDSIAAGAKKDLLDAERELADLRNRIADEKIPISKRLTQVEAESQEVNKEFDRVVRAADNVTVDLNTLGDKVKARRDDNIFVKNMMSSYVQSFSTNLHQAELATYADMINEATNIVDRPGAEERDILAAQVKVLDSALDRVLEIKGGNKFSGKALGNRGIEVSGNFVLIGPYAFFGDGAENVGFAERQINAALPIVVNKGIGEELTGIIANLTDTGTADFPFDPTKGDALKLKFTQESLAEHIQKGGITMVPLLGMAFFALVISIFKLFEISSVKRPKAGSIQQILDHLNNGNKQGALEIANSVDGPFGDLLVAGVENADKEKELLEEVLYERLLAAQPKLERLIAFVALTAAAAPLLGLLGTVTGMIDTFRAITVFGTGDPKTLSGGISVALITTEYGLIVAIPSLLLQALLSKLAKGKLSEMEQASVAFVNGLHKED
ncbi:MAG: MotA/TolQ/ExbB proton channel family protein [Verrucomicrobiota bacterium]